VNPSDLDRLDKRTREAVLAAAAALEKAGNPKRVFLWVATEVGSREADIAFWKSAKDEGGLLASPATFAATLPSALAGDVARILGLSGPAMVTVGPIEMTEIPVGDAEALLLLHDRPSGVEAVATDLSRGPTAAA
jgi:3-oxoacyl-(acyl-carrier-protein) synthase